MKFEKDKSNPDVWLQWEQAPIGQGKTGLMKIRYESTFDGLGVVSQLILATYG